MKNLEKLGEILDRFKDVKIMVIGDVMIDRYVRGSVNRMSPEAPVPVLDHQHSENRLGGAANVALNLDGLGAVVSLISVIGDDQEGRTFCRLLDDQGLSSTGIILSEDRITTVKTRLMAEDQHLLRVDKERADALSEDLEYKLLTEIKSTILKQKISAVLFQDYDKGILSERINKKIIDFAIEHNVQTYVDPKFNNFFSYQNTTLFKPNLVELRAKVPFDVEINEHDLARATKYIRNRLGCNDVLVTLSGDGIFFDHLGQTSWVPVVDCEISDVCGAGDTVISMVALGHQVGLRGWDLAYLACRAGTIVCQYPGVQPISREILWGAFVNVG